MKHLPRSESRDLHDPLARHDVCAPGAQAAVLRRSEGAGGQVLRIKMHLGEYAPTGVPATPLVMLGNVDPLYVRVDVDENDAWRVNTGAAATGCLRGNRDITTPLKFVRFEPYVIPKKPLMGDSAESVDTQVLQVI